VIKFRLDDQIGLAFVSAQISDWFRVQPMIQYVMNPGANKSLDNALVFGVRFEMSVSNQ